MARFHLVKSESVMGMGDDVYSVLATKTMQHIAYINEKAQVLFTKPLNLNDAQDVLQLLLNREEKQNANIALGMSNLLSLE
jgi:hypothetical protein